MIDPAVRRRIETELAALERAETARVLFACESGSRAWGFPSADSDYDVRFVYARPKAWYLSIDSHRRRDVIERPVSDDLDLSGWDVRKALGLYAASSPALGEWLQSPVVYLERPGFADRLRELAAAYFDPAAAQSHYRRMARGQYQRYLLGPSVRPKKYFYVTRPLLCAAWVERFGTAPPMPFADLLPLLDGQTDVRAELDDLLARKRAGGELDEVPPLPALHAYLTAELARQEAVPRPPARAAADLAALDHLFRDIVGA